MKSYPYILAAVAVFISIYIYALKSLFSDDRNPRDYDLLFYGADIYYVNYETKRVFTQSGSVDTTFRGLLALRDFVEGLTASDMNRLFDEENKLRSPDYIGIEQIGDSLTIVLTPRDEREGEVRIPIVNRDTLHTGQVFLYGEYTCK